MRNILWLLVLLSALNGGLMGERPGLTGPYLGQQPPGMTPEIFAPGIVSTGLDESTIAFTPDGRECYWTIHPNGFETILMSRLKDGAWTRPEVAPFCGEYLDGFPAIHPDGSRFFFHSYRPLAGSGTPAEHVNIWIMEREGDGWGTPRPIGPPINGRGNVTCPSVTRDGTLYFSGVMPDGSEKVMRSKYRDGVYLEPVPLPDNVNTTQYNFHACIAPDESYLVIPRLVPDERLETWNYFVAFCKNGTWSDLIRLDNRVNFSRLAAVPSMSADGRYLFFQATQPATFHKKIEARRTIAQWRERMVSHPVNNGKDIYWVDAGIIEALRPENVN
ncbi:MAG: PD40 domain-containing protein [Acidobacteria bacterium]|nr:PD40 domain-containing protein [Acidobacteriota bacterium]